MRKPRLLALASLLAACGPGTPASNPDGPPGPTVDAPPGSTADAAACATASYDAKLSPAALLVVLDRSSSMAMGNKWTYAAQAIVSALDYGVFDNVHLGLYAAPTGEIAGPACIFGLPVACQAPPFPQIDLTLAGAEKSNAATGVRRQIKDWLNANFPDGGLGDASPMYSALEAAIGSLRLWPVDGKRIILMVTDGTLSCTSFSTRMAFTDCNGCEDWEHPNNLVSLLGAANTDASEPIESFVVGVPGADTYDSTACNYPPYYMRGALSAIAYAGAPAYSPAGCTGTTFTAPGMNPTVPCHFDMTASFSADALADAIAQIRGQTLGCIFDMPEPPPGEVIDPNFVNVEYTADGTSQSIYKRSSPANMCTDTGCWDYTPDGRVELIGKACADIEGAQDVSVRIIVGCMTIIG